MEYSEIIIETFIESVEGEKNPARRLRILAEEIRLCRPNGQQIRIALARVAKCSVTNIDIEKTRQHCLEAARRIESNR